MPIASASGIGVGFGARQTDEYNGGQRRDLFDETVDQRFLQIRVPNSCLPQNGADAVVIENSLERVGTDRVLERPDVAVKRQLLPICLFMVVDADGTG